MDEQTSGTSEAVENKEEVDSWAAAFAALEQDDKENPKGDSDTGKSDVAGEDASTNESDGANADQDDKQDSTSDENDTGGLGDTAGSDANESSESTGSIFENVDVSDESIQKYEEELNTSIREQAINDIAQEFIKRGIRNTNGALGATMDDEDICKRDEDGVPHFYNPETGLEFRGDNPRRQAQEWIDDYNKELARVFNNACEQYEAKLKENSAPKLAVMKFAPKYEKLDDIRKGMFDNVIEDYEIKDDNGTLIGYSCDLEKALNLVEKQIKMIQSYAKQHQSQPNSQPSGPALDMKTSSGAVQSGNNEPPKSLAEAMEQLQNRELEKLK